jgi:hypothetical protein
LGSIDDLSEAGTVLWMGYRKRVPSIEMVFFRGLTKAFDIEFVRLLLT